MTEQIDDQKIRDLQKEYLDFLDDDGLQGYYTSLVNEMIKLDKVRLIVNINDLRKKIQLDVKHYYKVHLMNYTHLNVH